MPLYLPSSLLSETVSDLRTPDHQPGLKNLSAARIPKARWDEDTDSAIADSDDDLTSLDIQSTVLSASFGLSETYVSSFF